MKAKAYHKQSPRPQKVVLPPTPDQRKAKNLPMFGPGISIPIPLHLVPAYMALYGLKPTGWRADGTLTVKREPSMSSDGKEG